jgi:hypothetical protein
VVCLREVRDNVMGEMSLQDAREIRFVPIHDRELAHPSRTLRPESAHNGT